jgi:PadR family transcriptional regulator PadR
LELLVMSALAAREFYGYEMVEHLKSACGISVSDGTLYAILIRLKNEGFVRHRWEHAETGPARKYYSLTKSGHAALDGMREIWADIARAVQRVGAGRERKYA